MSLALSTLLYEWRRYMAAVIALALSGMLMLVLGAFLIGMLQSVTATIDRSRGQLLVMSAKATSIAGRTPSMPARVVPLVYRHPQVQEVQDLDLGGGAFYGPGSPAPTFVMTMIVDTAPNAVTLPQDFTEEMRQALAIPYNIAVDKSALAALKVKLGDEATYNGKTVRVGLILDGYANTQQPTIVISRQTMRLMGNVDDSRVGMLVVRLKDSSQMLKVQRELNAMADGQYKVWTKQELSKATVRDVMQEGQVVIIMGFLNVIGIIIGVVIGWQTLRGAILANIKEFASLRALGVSIGQLRGVVMELSFWVGILGIIMAGVLMFGTAMLASAGSVPMGFDPNAVIQTSILLLMISIVSGALTLGALKKGEPADLLK